jgi:ABC-2 type transport system ATP-binding protein
VQALADRVVIIDLGRIVAEGSLAELLASSGTVVRAEDDVRLRSALDAAGLDPRPAIDGGFVVEARPELVGRAALDGGIALSRLAPLDGSGLEQLFFDLTAGATNGARADRGRSPHEHGRTRITTFAA